LKSLVQNSVKKIFNVIEQPGLALTVEAEKNE